ncbi:MAG: radical SAM protein, partial [Gemmatimonadota bacterium]
GGPVRGPTSPAPSNEEVLLAEIRDLLEGARLTRMRMRPLRLSSGAPWHLSLRVEAAGSDFVCRIGGGDAHVGAVALAEWKDGRAAARALTAEGHKETAIATHAAHRICLATRRRVTCVAGIHFDDLRREQIDEISRAAYRLAERAARRLEDRRLRAAVRDPDGPLVGLLSPGDGLDGEVEAFLARPLEALLEKREPGRPGVGAPGGRVLLFAPLYLTNACSNDCAYCGFRRSASYERRTLDLEAAVRQAEVLAERGHRTIDLVTGEVAADPFVDRVCRICEAILARTPIRTVNLNLGALSGDQLRRLREAGATGYHLYQETYDPATYFRVHRRGLKRDMAWRLDGPRRAAAAGFDRIGLGVLVGLRPLGRDLPPLVRHARRLRAEFPGLRLGLSLPRLRHADPECAFTPPAPASDDELAKAFLFLRSVLPDADLTVTTRERPDLRDALLRLGISKMSAGVSTAPGGYAAAGEKPTGQFEIEDERSVDEIVAAIAATGRTPAFE